LPLPCVRVGAGAGMGEDEAVADRTGRVLVDVPVVVAAAVLDPVEGAGANVGDTGRVDAVRAVGE